MKIDIFTHITPKRYKEALTRVLPRGSHWQNVLLALPALYDIDLRLKIVDKHQGLRQMLTVSAPPIEFVASVDKAVELCQIANDEMAELVQKYPDKFIAAAACLPMNDVGAALNELDRAITQLGHKGVQLITPVYDKPLDSPEYLPLFDKIAGYDLPIWLHPYRDPTHADYKSESLSKFRIYHRFGWPYETTVAMARLVYSGVLEKYPKLKFITHHCGGMIPYFSSRTETRPNIPEAQRTGVHATLTREPVEYFKMFYGDTANVNPAALMCGMQFFGTDHILFGTDMPYGPDSGDAYIRQAIGEIESMDISRTEKKAIFSDNARKLLKLP